MRLEDTLRRSAPGLGLAVLLLLGAAGLGAGPIACMGPLARPVDPVVMDPPEDLAHPARLWEGAFESGGARLNAIAYVATGPGPHPTVVLLHGFPGNERNLDLAQALRRGGWNVVFFHYRGAWGSGGDFSFGRALEDVEAVVEQVRAPAFAASTHTDPARVSLVGHSMGGFMAIAGAAESPTVRCAVGIAAANLARGVRAAASDPAVAARTADRLDAMARGKLAGTSGETLLAELIAGRVTFDLMRRAGAVADRPLLLVAGARDRVVPVVDQKDLVDRVARAGDAEARLVILDADHAFSSQRLALAREVLAFLDVYCR
jgi:hypothetical protein